jgi:hypothetical protein
MLDIRRTYDFLTTPSQNKTLSQTILSCLRLEVVRYESYLAQMANRRWRGIQLVHFEWSLMNKACSQWSWISSLSQKIKTILGCNAAMFGFRTNDGIR